MNTSDETKFQNALLEADGFEVDEFDDEREFLDDVFAGPSIEALIAEYGKADWTDETEFGIVFTWYKVQSAKGKTRGDLKAMVTGDTTLMAFSGE